MDPADIEKPKVAELKQKVRPRPSLVQTGRLSRRRTFCGLGRMYRAMRFRSGIVAAAVSYARNFAASSLKKRSCVEEGERREG